jgi:hypothetical protein|tara:strand:- start:63 stop:410 length:348 start_codon:yes stop_codon:yes gene_type:complete
MKNLILLIAVLFVSACAATPTVKSVVGVYGVKADGNIWRTVFLEDGVAEYFVNDEKYSETNWTISKDGEILSERKDGFIGVYGINKDGSLTRVAHIDRAGERVPVKVQVTIDKIK